jgi:hypothetical protein
MEQTWTQRADKVLRLYGDLPVVTQDGAEKEFRRAVWELCQQLKDADDKGGQFIPPSIMGD